MVKKTCLLSLVLIVTPNSDGLGKTQSYLSSHKIQPLLFVKHVTYLRRHVTHLFTNMAESLGKTASDKF